jgi:predicted transposase YdaD
MEAGMAKGLEQGLAKGLEQGLEQGRSAGREEARTETARAMKLRGLDPGLIVEVTGLDRARVDSL